MIRPAYIASSLLAIGPRRGWSIRTTVHGGVEIRGKSDRGVDEARGKRLVGVSVVTEDGSSATRRDTAVRTAVLMAPFPVKALLGTFLGGFGFFVGSFLMAGWLLVETVAMVLSDDGQRVGDRVAGTYVVGE